MHLDTAVHLDTTMKKIVFATSYQLLYFLILSFVWFGRVSGTYLGIHLFQIIREISYYTRPTLPLIRIDLGAFMRVVCQIMAGMAPQKMFTRAFL